NIESLPEDFVFDDAPRGTKLIRIDSRGREEQTVRVTSRAMPNGDFLVVARTLVLGLVPALCLCLATGVLLSRRAQGRVDEVSKRVQRIIAGDLRQRLPTRGADDPFDKLASIVNGMLDEIEALIHEVAGVGDDIAHDLRTPLTRVRITLERGRENAQNLGELQAVVDHAMDGIDQSLAVITALLRIAEIEHSQ